MWNIVICVSFEYIFLVVNLVFIIKSIVVKVREKKDKGLKKGDEDEEGSIFYLWVLGEVRFILFQFLFLIVIRFLKIMIMMEIIWKKMSLIK